MWFVPIYHAVSRAAKDVRHVTGTAAEYHIRQQPNNMIHMHGLHAIYTRKIRAVVLALNVQWHAFYSNFYYITIYLDHYITLINITTTVSQVLVPSSIWKIWHKIVSWQACINYCAVTTTAINGMHLWFIYHTNSVKTVQLITWSSAKRVILQSNRKREANKQRQITGKKLYSRN